MAPLRKAYISDALIPTVEQDDERGSNWQLHFAAREEALDAIFGDESRPGFVSAPRSFGLIKRCPGASVKSYRPCDDRQAWHYVTNGLAQPGNKFRRHILPEKACGFGCEYVLSSEHEGPWQNKWLLDVMTWVAVHDMRIQPDESIGPGQPIVKDGNPDLTCLISFTDTAYATQIILPGGVCNLIHLLGVTAAECEYALTHSQIRQQGIRALASFFITDDPFGPITDGNRPCLTRDPDFPEMWLRAIKQVERNWRW